MVASHKGGFLNTQFAQSSLSSAPLFKRFLWALPDGYTSMSLLLLLYLLVLIQQTVQGVSNHQNNALLTHKPSTTLQLHSAF